MSLLFITYHEKEQEQNKKFDTVSIMRKVAKFLFKAVMEPLSKTSNDKEFLDKAEAYLLLENIDFTDLSADEFNKAYDIIAQNATNEILKPFAPEILTKMQADPRFEPSEHAMTA